MFRILKMDKVLLAACAAKLEKLFLQYEKVDSEVRDLHETLSPLIVDGQNGNVTQPMEWGDVPGAYYFSEGDLRKYRDLESAYAEFKIELTGGESPVLRDIRLSASTKR